MRSNLSIASAVLFLFAAPARASSLISPDYVEDFGPNDVSTSAASPATRPTGHVSLISPNYIDDFGPNDVSASTASSATRPTGHVSLISPNYIDDFGLEAPSSGPTTVGAAEDSIQTALNQPKSGE